MAVNPYNKPSHKLIEEMLKEFDIELRIADGVMPSSGNNWGMPLSNIPTRAACDYLATRTGFQKS